MSDGLNLREYFPPVSAREWEDLIQQDLRAAGRGEDVIRTVEEGIPVRLFYNQEHTSNAGIDVPPPDRPWEDIQAWTPPANAVRADSLFEAGATAVQQLALSLSEAVEKLASAADRGEALASAAGATHFVFAIGSNYFVEIAKLRAARLLWRAVVNAFGCDDPDAATARIHARTGRLNKSHLDAYTNLLRATTEAMAAVIGGCDSLTVEAFDFDPHLANSVQHILREEAQLGRVSDPLSGSYYLEALTESLAQESWRVFQEIEAAGGWTAALNSGRFESQLAAQRNATATALAQRRRTLVGVNWYPNPKDNLPADLLPAQRLAEPFEKLRLRTQRHGSAPTVLLLTRGDLKLRTARAHFCRNFFGCAGFEIIESADIGELRPDLIVLCSSDAEYPSLANDICRLTTVPVLIAGLPKRHTDALQAAGIQGFVHAGSDMVATLTHWQDRLGLP